MAQKKPGKQISIRIDPDLVDWIDEDAAKENRSRNNWIETALMKGLNMKKCNCGEEWEDKANFCGCCGRPLNKVNTPDACKKDPESCDSIPPGSCGVDCHGFERQ